MCGNHGILIAFGIGGVQRNFNIYGAFVIWTDK